MTRDARIFVLLLLSVPLSGFGQGAASAGAGPTARKNVILIMADDFNHWLPGVGYYALARTPNLDALAAKGVLFANTSSASPVCNPSRQALWSGLSPARTRIDLNMDPFIRDVPGYANVVTMNQHFLEAGYYVYGGGKLYHRTSMGTEGSDEDYWSDVYEGPVGAPAGSYYHWKADANNGVIEWSASTAPIEQAYDTRLALHMADKIAGYSSSEQRDKPFFLAVGFFRPHVPWHAPKQFFDLYDPADVRIPRGYFASDLDDLPGETSTAEHREIVAESQWREAIRAYLANLSYADYNVGIVLDALEASPYRDNTIVVFTGDHGWHLGEKLRWKKATLYDQASRTSMIVYDPGRTTSSGISSKAVSMLDIYPTVAGLAGTGVPRQLDGRSLEPLLDSPDDPRWDFPVVMRYDRVNALKTNEWRFVDDGGQSQLYDMVNDPFEFTNLYRDPQYAGRVRILKQQLRERTGTRYVSVVGLPDSNGNGSPELGVVRSFEYERADGLSRDSATGLAVGSANFFESGLEAVDLAVVPDVSGRGRAKLAALFRHPGGQAVVQLQDAASASGTASLRFFGKAWDATAVCGIDRGRGVPDIAVLGIRKDNFRAGIQIRPAVGGGNADWIYFPVDPARYYLDVAVLEDSNGNGHAEIAALYTLADGSAQVDIVDSVSKEPVDTVTFSGAQLFNGTASAIGVSGVGDRSGDGSPDVAVLWRKANGQGVAEIRDVVSGRRVRELQFFGKDWHVVSVASLDGNGDGRSDIAVLAVRNDGAGAAVQVRDASSGQALSWIGYPSSPN